MLTRNLPPIDARRSNIPGCGTAVTRVRMEYRWPPSLTLPNGANREYALMTPVVIGAGLAGLSAPCYLTGRGYDVTVIERLNRPVSSIGLSPAAP